LEKIQKAGGMVEVLKKKAEGYEKKTEVH
jgi:hypothetical protein